eukprot:CAMPEP_0172432132 /NCGR_PEP_ID=MMETSP1064-20121228/61649_1 /TAXON_ID=202472 /ORGANISM="Aulacoseira subarctica , Strain CCAP 1002/5" /LENGTH=155 /DNA_ID=CAMNT_0013179213 /DNA_START=120 /DNA_END=584 /DNA_ORIENTATION=-
MAGSARTRTKSTKSTATSMVTTNDAPRFEHVTTLRNFDKFQSRIFPIIQRIVQASKSSNFKFCNDWIAATKNPTFTFDGNTTFHDIKKEFKMSELPDYRRFLSTCPMINDYVIFRDAPSGTSGFEYYIKQAKPMQSAKEQANLVLDVPDTPKTIN